MGIVEQKFGNITATSATLSHQLRDLWKSPRGTLVRIEALALLAIALSFFLAAFGSCRRWSGHWIVQKGVLAANVVSLSLGTYSIGLMQSSPVKSEVYPIWAVSRVRFTDRKKIPEVTDKRVYRISRKISRSKNKTKNT
jgi:hypothetical protein